MLESVDCLLEIWFKGAGASPVINPWFGRFKLYDELSDTTGLGDKDNRFLGPLRRT